MYFKKREHRHSRTTNRQGFSLVEILTVLAIIGMLLAIVGVNVRRARERGRITTTKASVKNIADALELYSDEANRYPTDEEGLNVLTQTLNGLEPLLLPGELKDGWGREFVYRNLIDEDQPFEISSAGQDGEHGTADDISNFNSE